MPKQDRPQLVPYLDSDNILQHIAGVPENNNLAIGLIEALRSVGDTIWVRLKQVDHDDRVHNNSEYGMSQLKLYNNSLSDESVATIIHEMTHAYTDKIGYDEILEKSIYFTDPEDSNNILYKQQIIRGYQEATAITVEEKFRKEMGYISREEAGGAMIDINGYGVWPWFIAHSANKWHGKVYLQNSITIRQSLGIYLDFY